MNGNLYKAAETPLSFQKNNMQDQLQKSKNNIRKIITAFIVFSIIASVTGCGPSAKMTIIGSWVNKEKISGKSGNSVFIIVITQNMQARSTLENDLAAAAQASGIKAVKSLAVFTPVTGVADSVVLAALMRAINASGCTTILTVAIIDEKSETKYHPASSYTYQPYPYYGYYGTFTSYYNYSFNMLYAPGYYTTKKTYYLETNLYNVANQDILFSIQTKAANPPEINKASKQFTETLIDELKSNGLLKKG